MTNIVGCFLDMWPLRVSVERRLTLRNAIRSYALNTLSWTKLRRAGYTIIRQLPQTALKENVPKNYSITFHRYPNTGVPIPRVSPTILLKILRPGRHHVSV